MLILKFKGKAKQVFQEWGEMVKTIGHVTLGELRPLNQKDGEKNDKL